MKTKLNWKEQQREKVTSEVLHLVPENLQQKDLTDILPEVEEYTINKLIPAISKGGFISEQEKMELIYYDIIPALKALMGWN